jgi:hypothetical protein
VESPAEAAARIAIPEDKLGDLLEHPKIAALVVLLQSDPKITAKDALELIPGLPLLGKSVGPNRTPALDIGRLEGEIRVLSQLGERGEGLGHNPDRVTQTPMLMGELDKQRKEASRRLALLSASYDLLRGSFQEAEELKLNVPPDFKNNLLQIYAWIQQELQHSGIKI